MFYGSSEVISETMISLHYMNCCPKDIKPEVFFSLSKEEGYVIGKNPSLGAERPWLSPCRVRMTLEDVGQVIALSYTPVFLASGS